MSPPILNTEHLIQVLCFCHRSVPSSVQSHPYLVLLSSDSGLPSVHWTGVLSPEALHPPETLHPPDPLTTEEGEEAAGEKQTHTTCYPSIHSFPWSMTYDTPLSSQTALTRGAAPALLPQQVLLVADGAHAVGAWVSVKATAHGAQRGHLRLVGLLCHPLRQGAEGSPREEDKSIGRVRK